MSNDELKNVEENEQENAPVQESAEQEVKEESPVQETAETVDATNVAEENKEETVEAPAEEKPVEEPKVEEPKPEEAKTEETKEEAPAKETESPVRSQRQQYFDEVFNELKEKMKGDEPIEVEVKSRIRGGLRVHYRDIALFLPTSHFSLKRNPSEEELKNSLDTKFKVHVHEYQEFDEGRKAVIVSRKKLLLDETWDKLQVDEVIEGKVSSVASFGVFVEFEGVEGLIHISRLSRIHVADPNKMFKKGDKIKAKIIEISKEKNRIGLSRKEVEDSPWKGIEEEIKAGEKVKGIVRRLTDFGAYIELKPGVDGLLRNNELSWTKRVKKPSELLKEGSEIEVEVINISEEKENASLSYKRTQPNPWPSLVEKYPIGAEFEATIMQVIPQGAIVNVTDDLDGFMPRSKMRPVMKGKKIPYKSGDTLTVEISDINPDEESLILAPKVDESMQQETHERPERRSSAPKQQQQKSGNSFSLGDMLNQASMDKLKNMSSEDE